MDLTDILEYIGIFFALIVVLPIHEFAHAFVADRCGDPTPRLNKRLTLNPLAHFDIYGLLCLLFVHFGWGKPVPINPTNFKHYRMDSVFVSLAGVVANWITGFIGLGVFYLVLHFNLFTGLDEVDAVWFYFLSYVPALSFSLFAFNLLPIYPLDGYQLWSALDKKRGKLIRFCGDYGEKILLVLIILGIVADYSGIWQLDFLGIYINWLSGIVSVPASLFWGLFF